jgi:GNAT superfamily N-acetyltransferase
VFSIRQAQENDTSTILQLIRELAEYERLLHQVMATEDGLQRTLFGPRRYAEVLLAEFENQAAGYALFFHNFSTFVGGPGIYLEDLYVRPAFRGQGIGKAFFQHLARLAVERNCDRLDWAVLNWNEQAIRFYQSLGAVPMTDWTAQRISGDSLKRLADS